MIPKKWFVERTVDNYKKFNTLANTYAKGRGHIRVFNAKTTTYFHCDNPNIAEMYTDCQSRNGYERISIEQFEAIVTGKTLVDTYEII